MLYPLQTIPCLLKHKDINQLNKAFFRFILREKRPRVALTKLYLPKSEGGLNFPNIGAYNPTSLLRHAFVWVSDIPKQDWSKQQNTNADIVDRLAEGNNKVRKIVGN